MDSYRVGATLAVALGNVNYIIDFSALIWCNIEKCVFNMSTLKSIAFIIMLLTGVC